MSDGSFIPVAALSLDRVTLAFNRAFTGYYLPMAQTPRTLARIMRETDVNLDDSVALTVEGDLAGIALVAVRGERAWIAGMGVDPRYRRQGFGRRLLLRLVSGLRDAGLRMVWLEALSVNAPAIALYLSAGFMDIRALRVYQSPLRFDAHRTWDDPKERIGAISWQAALADFDAFHQMRPAWQREARSIARTAQRMKGVGLWRGQHLRAYLLFARRADGVIVYDAGATGPDREVCATDLARLLARVAGPREGIPIRAINVPVGDALDDALVALGGRVVATQREMALDLAAPGDHTGEGGGAGRGLE